MALTKNFWNKFVDLELKDKAGAGVTLAKIQCPKFGQKPDIEINAELTAADALAALNITVRSLYIDELGKNVAKVRVNAGYKDGETAEWEGSVSEFYTSEPGPDKGTVIQCNMGHIADWTRQGVDVSVDAGGSLEDAVKALSNVLGLDEPLIQGGAGSQKLDAGFQFNGEAREAAQKLKRFFPETMILIQEKRLVVFKTKDDTGEGVSPVEIDVLTSPPQLLGGKDGTSAVVTAPWNPKVKPGSVVTFPSKYYQSAGIVRSAQDDTKMRVYFVSVHFSTVKNINKMVLRGVVLQGGK
ncbi:MAG: hypothetical protein II814_07970 [Treponema sp.]|nr:hypothetical protein [Treponema sp.]